MRSDLILLKDMYDSAKMVSEFVSGMTRESFLTDDKTQSAVQHRILIMGEAASKVSDTFKSQHLSIPWAEIIHLRNFYIHAYHQVDTNRLWRSLHGVVADVERKAAPLIPPEDESR